VCSNFLELPSLTRLNGYSGSQEERIAILKTALTEKGVHAGSHYDLKSDLTSTHWQRVSAATTETAPLPNDESDEDDSGIHL
jgi:hypothetical protein